MKLFYTFIHINQPQINSSRILQFCLQFFYLHRFDILKLKKTFETLTDCKLIIENCFQHSLIRKIIILEKNCLRNPDLFLRELAPCIFYFSIFRLRNLTRDVTAWTILTSFNAFSSARPVLLSRASIVYLLFFLYFQCVNIRGT